MRVLTSLSQCPTLSKNTQEMIGILSEFPFAMATVSPPSPPLCWVTESVEQYPATVVTQVGSVVADYPHVVFLLAILLLS